MTDQTETPATVLGDAETAAAEATGTAAPDYITAMQNAHDIHSDAVNFAHETLRERVGNAYDIFSSDLDRAYKVWENTARDIRQVAGIIGSSGGHNATGHQDPTTAA